MLTLEEPLRPHGSSEHQHPGPQRSNMKLHLMSELLRLAEYFRKSCQSHRSGALWSESYHSQLGRLNNMGRLLHRSAQLPTPSQAFPCRAPQLLEWVDHAGHQDV